MTCRTIQSPTVRRLTCLAVSLAVVGVASWSQADSRRALRRAVPVKNTKLDPQAGKVELFEALQAGTLDAVLIPKDELQGQVFIQNKSDKPLTVQLPEAIVGVQVLKQLGGLGGGLDGGFGGGDEGGGSQPLGGGMGGMMGGMGGMMGGMGGGFFSIPPEQIVKVPCNTVCLAHGKPDPTSRMRYRLVEPEKFTDDAHLHELLRLVGTRRIDPQIAQAAAWHLTDNMSWEELAAKHKRRLGGLPPEPYFSRAQLLGAQRLLAVAAEIARERKEGKPRRPADGVLLPAERTQAALDR